MGPAGRRLWLLSSSLIVLLLIPLPSSSAHAQSLNGHAVRLDASGKLLAWPLVQGDAYDQVLGLATNFFLNGVPTAPNGMKLYYSESYANHTDPLTGAGWPHNPAGLYSMLTDSGLLYYAYSGNVAMANLVRDVLTYRPRSRADAVDLELARRRVRQRRLRRAHLSRCAVRQLRGSGGWRRRHRARQGRRDRRRVPEVLRVQRSRPLPGRGGEGG